MFLPKNRHWTKTQAGVPVILTLLVHGAAVGQTPPSYDFVTKGVQTAKVDNSTGVPRLLINGQPVPPLLFFFNYSPDRQQYLAPQMQKANAAGIHVFSLVFKDFPWDPASATFTPDFSDANALMDQFLSIDPQAVFLLRVVSTPPSSWSDWATHGEWGTIEDILYSDGTTTIDSIASDRYLQGFLSGVTRMVQHYEASTYAPHILGYHISGQNTGEWFANQYRDKGLDYSPVNTAAFRNWLQQKYGTDAALSQAWGRFVTLNAAPVPIPAAGRFPMHGAAPGDPVQEFYTLPAQQQDWVDYSDYTSDIFSSQILSIAHAVRTASSGKRLVAFFNGYIYDLPGSMSGHLRMDRLLASPDIDMIAAPVSYIGLEERLAGGAGGAMGALDSVALHGKIWMNEDDLRTYLAANLPDFGYNGDLPTADFFETSNVLQRNLASVLVHRGGTWWMDLNATGAFDDADLWATVMGDLGLPLFNQSYANPAPYRPEVAVITDERSVLYQASDWDFMFVPRSLLRNAIAKAGVTVGYYDLSDFLSGALPPAKVYVFVNAFYLTDAQITTIRNRLQLEGATAIWQYAPGYLGPNGPDVTRTSTLTGIQLSVVGGYSGSTGASSMANHVWGWAWETPRVLLTPRLVVTDPNVTVWGRYWSDNAASTVYKRANGFTSVFVGDVGWNVDMVRQLLASVGVHIWTSAGDVIHSDGSLLVVHAGSAGTRSISLPAGVTATPLSGGTPTTNLQPLQTSFARTGETQWFRLAPAPSCDINGDGNTTAGDVQAIINEALGVTPAISDLNGDGVVNVLDVQIVINAVSGLGCASRP